MKIHVLCILMIVIFCALWCHETDAVNVQCLENYGSIPLAFTLNQGRLNSTVKYSTHGKGCTIYFCPTETTFLLSLETEQSIEKRKTKQSAVYQRNPLREKKSEKTLEQYALKLRFINANTSTDIIGEDLLSWNNNFIGNVPNKCFTDVPNYKKIRLRDVYDGIDLVYYGNMRWIKYDFIVDPGVDPSQILLSYDAGDSEKSVLSVNDTGELVVSTPLGDIIERKPFCYQIIVGKKVEIDIH